MFVECRGRGSDQHPCCCLKRPRRR